MSYEEVMAAVAELDVKQRYLLMMGVAESLRKPLHVPKQKRVRKEGAEAKPPSDWQTGLAVVRVVLKTHKIAPKVPLVTQIGKALKDLKSWPNPAEAEIMAAYEAVPKEAVAVVAEAVVAVEEKAAVAVEEKAAVAVEKAAVKKEKKKAATAVAEAPPKEAAAAAAAEAEAAAAGGGGGAAEAAAAEAPKEVKKVAKKKAPKEDEVDYFAIEEAAPWTHRGKTYLRQENCLWTNDGNNTWVGMWDATTNKVDKTVKEPEVEGE